MTFYDSIRKEIKSELLPRRTGFFFGQLQLFWYQLCKRSGVRSLTNTLFNFTL